MWKYFLCLTCSDSHENVSQPRKEPAPLPKRHSLAVGLKGVSKTTYERQVSHELNSKDDDRMKDKYYMNRIRRKHHKMMKSSTKARKFMEKMGYILGKEIGKGTFAKVKIASSRKYEEPLACKIISKIDVPQQLLTQFLPREIEAASKLRHSNLIRFLPREIDVVRGLRHENLIRFYQSIESTHRVYIIMQLAEKGSLFDLIRQSGYLNDTNSRKYCRQLTSAIEYCHSQGVVHRDIKCENLLLDKEWNLKVIDFGFAKKNMTSNTSNEILSETYCGSYAYVSPEVLKGQPYDPHMSDIWAIGVVLFAMVFGRLPFDGSNYNQLLKQVQSKLIFPRTPNVSATCKNLLTKILAPLKIRVTIKQMKQDPWYNQVT